MLTIKRNMVAESAYGLKCPHEMIPTYITIHNSADDVSAEILVAWMVRHFGPTSFHFAVDDREIWQGVECERTAHHCGDGPYGPGNSTSIGIEICDNSFSDFDKAMKNAAELVAFLMRQYGIPLDHVVQHNHWDGSDCPARIRREDLWNEFIKKVEVCYGSYDSTRRRTGKKAVR